jgi:aspartate aminotransferase-like enzyme
MAELGLPVLAPLGAQSATVSAFRGNEAISAAELRTALNREHAINVAGGMDDLAGKIIRIGHMAELARPGPQLQTISAIAYELGRRGHSARRSPTERFMDAWSQTH